MKRVVSILALVLFVSFFVSPSFAATQKEWTYMVYINGNNNLSSYGVKNQNEMAKVGSNDFLNIVTLLAQSGKDTVLNYVEKNHVTQLKNYGRPDMGDYKQLVSFFKDIATQYPAKHYALIIWNHGSGWKNVGSEIIKGISYDDASGNHITTAQLGTAMGQIKQFLGRNLDIVGMDACLMAMMEVAYVLRGSVDYMVGSEETEPGDGYPYDKILSPLTAQTSVEDFTKVWVKAYADSFNGGSHGNYPSTQSSINIAKLDALKDAIDGFAKTVMAGSFAPQFKTALGTVQHFYYSTNIDLLNLLALLKGSINDAGFLTAANKLEAAVKDAVVANGTSQASMANACGLAIYFPTTSTSFDAAYKQLAFATDCQWMQMVQDFYVKTTAPTIIADVEAGNVNSLVDYAKTANENNREVTNALIAQLNFRVFAEGGLDASVQDNVKSLVTELRNK
ncbi:MAG: hypothetical protein HQM08_12030 [Candidatus Riflebacteria bacterium]|nr:hypothetical protein [Candidatus Riflebacteria bacterium]